MASNRGNPAPAEHYRVESEGLPERISTTVRGRLFDGCQGRPGGEEEGKSAGAQSEKGRDIMDIRLQGIMETRQVFLNGAELLPAQSLKVRNHSPDGFCWGYGGSGPAQLALAILINITDRHTAEANYQQFKWDVVAGLLQKDFDITINVDKYIK
jgi:hypothetical protein